MTIATGMCDRCKEVFSAEDLVSGYDDQHFCENCEIKISIEDIEENIEYQKIKINRCDEKIKELKESLVSYEKKLRDYI